MPISPQVHSAQQIGRIHILLLHHIHEMSARQRKQPGIKVCIAHSKQFSSPLQGRQEIIFSCHNSLRAHGPRATYRAKKSSTNTCAVNAHYIHWAKFTLLMLENIVPFSPDSVVRLKSRWQNVCKLQ